MYTKADDSKQSNTALRSKTFLSQQSTTPKSTSTIPFQEQLTTKCYIIILHSHTKVCQKSTTKKSTIMQSHQPVLAPPLAHSGSRYHWHTSQHAQTEQVSKAMYRFGMERQGPPLQPSPSALKLGSHYYHLHLKIEKKTGHGSSLRLSRLARAEVKTMFFNSDVKISLRGCKPQKSTFVYFAHVGTLDIDRERAKNVIDMLLIMFRYHDVNISPALARCV